VGERRSAYRVVVWKPQEKRTLGRPRLRWEDSSEMNLQKWDWGMDWLDLAQDRTDGGHL
jgi:hypothetical protein